MPNLKGFEYTENTPVLSYRRLDSIDPKEVGMRLKEIRDNLGLTGDIFAKLLKITPAGVIKLERGEATPSGKVLYLLHEMFGVDIQWLLFGVHSTRSDILTALYSLPDDDLFDIFTRMYAYLLCGDRGCFSQIDELPGVNHFAKLNKDMFKPLSKNDKGGSDVPYTDWNLVLSKSEGNKSSDLIEQISTLTKEEQEQILSSIKKSKLYK